MSISDSDMQPIASGYKYLRRAYRITSPFLRILAVNGPKEYGESLRQVTFFFCFPSTLTCPVGRRPHSDTSTVSPYRFQLLRVPCLAAHPETWKRKRALASATSIAVSWGSVRVRPEGNGGERCIPFPFSHSPSLSLAVRGERLLESTVHHLRPNSRS